MKWKKLVFVPSVYVCLLLLSITMATFIGLRWTSLFFNLYLARLASRQYHFTVTNCWKELSRVISTTAIIVILTNCALKSCSLYLYSIFKLGIYTALKMCIRFRRLVLHTTIGTIASHTRLIGPRSNIEYQVPVTYSAVNPSNSVIQPNRWCFSEF